MRSIIIFKISSIFLILFSKPSVPYPPSIYGRFIILKNKGWLVNSSNRITSKCKFSGVSSGFRKAVLWPGEKDDSDRLADIMTAPLPTMSET